MEEKFNLTLSIKNYKQIGTEVPFEASVTGDVLLITGDNRKGKTGLVNAIADAWSLKSSTPDPLTTGAESGFKKLRFPDLDGEPITIVHNFTNDNPSGMFYAIRDNGKVINSVPAIRKLIGDYAPLTVEQFFASMKYAESRKQLVKNYLLPLMSANFAEIETINKQVNENGTLYKQRTEVNNELKVLQNIPTQELTDTEKQLLANEALIIETLEKLEQTHKQLLHTNSKTEIFVRFLNDYIVQSFSTIIAKINDTLPDFSMYVNKFKTEKDYYSDLVDQQNNLLDAARLEDSKIVERINKGNEAKNNLFIIKQKSIQKSESEVKIKELQAKQVEINNQIEKLKAQREKLIKASNIPAGIETDGETITLSGYDMVSEQVSYSEAALAIAEIMAQLFNSKIICMGSISEFGPEGRKKIFELAKKYNKLVVLTQVTGDSEVKLNCIVE